MAGALANLQVLELARSSAAPFCTKLLAGCGAEVIKIEPPGVGDPTRTMGPFKDDVPHPEKSVLFLHLNTSKKSITLDPASETGKVILLRLIQDTDILVEDLGPQDLADMGLDYPSLERINPRLIMASISFFGQTGPYRDYRANELTGFAMGGYMHITGHPDREPVKAAGNVGQYQGGLHAVVGIMAALLYRSTHGVGQHIDVSTTESLAFSTNAMGDWLNHGQVQRRVGNRNASPNPRALYPSTFLPCKDGWIHAHHAPTDFTLLAVLMEEPRLASPEIVESPRGHADLMDELCLPWLSRYDKFEVVRRAQELRHPFTEVLDILEVLQDPQHEARGYFVEVEHPVAGAIKQPGAPFRASGTPWQTTAAPLLGQHNEAVYCQRLGYSKEDLVRLRELGVI
ncbi:MAG TPA: CoA transferase [Dehalococcoidia bacterium]|nr:CoA transferase [Dehalococcoidia bacterium]